MELNSKDKAILAELDRNSRQSFSQIGKKIRLPKHVVAYRIKSMVDSGIITSFYSVVDITKLGYNYSRLLLKFRNISDEKENEIVEYFKSKKQVGFLASLDGHWDMVAVIHNKDVFDLQNFYDDFIYKFDKHVVDKTISIATEVYHFRNKFLFENKDISFSVVGSGERAEIDSTDIEILNLLTEDARMPVVDIAKKVNLSARMVCIRIRQLVSKGILKEFRVGINYEKLGYNYFKVFIKLDNLTKDSEQKLISFLKVNPNVIYITKALWEWTLEFEVVLHSHSDLYTLINTLRKNFVNISEYQIILNSKVYNIRYALH